MKATVSGVLEDLSLKISEGSDQNWSCPESALLAVSAKLKVLKYSQNCSLHNTLITWSLKNPESPNIYAFIIWLVSLKIRNQAQKVSNPFLEPLFFGKILKHLPSQYYLCLCNSDLNLNLRSKTGFKITLIIPEVMITYSSQDLGTSLTTYERAFCFFSIFPKTNKKFLTH